jgi:hypothetical protein
MLITCSIPSPGSCYAIQPRHTYRTLWDHVPPYPIPSDRTSFRTTLLHLRCLPAEGIWDVLGLDLRLKEYEEFVHTWGDTDTELPLPGTHTWPVWVCVWNVDFLCMFWGANYHMYGHVPCVVPAFFFFPPLGLVNWVAIAADSA